MFDLAVCNEFELFITVTLSPELIDRYDYKLVTRKLGQWLDNLVRRHGFAYVMVPELHKDGALHFHGLVRKAGLKLALSGHKSRGKDVYNILNWRWGFTTAVELSGEYENVCKYLTKYIRKDMDTGTIGGRYYFHGGELQKPWFVYYNGNIEETEGKLYEIPEASLKLRYVSY